MFVLKVATSAWRRKSQSTTCATRFLQNAIWQTGNIFDRIVQGTSSPLSLIPGVGSAEGLGSCFLHDSGRKDNDRNPIMVGNRRVLVMFDEFRRLEKKGSGEGAVLLEMFCELFEKNDYYNIVKDRPLQIDDGHLGCLANTTKDNYETLVDARAMQDGGFLNRWFIVSVERPRIRKSRIKHPTKAELQPLCEEMAALLKKLPPLHRHGTAQEEIVLDMTPDAFELWDKWYNEVPETDATARLDSYGYRLMGLFAFLAGKDVVDAEVMRAVLALLAYQQAIRELHKPIIANNEMAEMEQRILTKMPALESRFERDVITKRELQNGVRASRFGVGVFNQALANLFKNGQLREGQFTEHNGKCKVTKTGYKLVED